MRLSQSCEGRPELRDHRGALYWPGLVTRRQSSAPGTSSWLLWVLPAAACQGGYCCCSKLCCIFILYSQGSEPFLVTFSEDSVCLCFLRKVSKSRVIRSDHEVRRDEMMLILMYMLHNLLFVLLKKLLAHLQIKLLTFQQLNPYYLFLSQNGWNLKYTVC